MFKPILAVVGHVDVGKTSFLDYFSDTKTKEINNITQEIRVSEYSSQEIKDKFVVDSFVNNFNLNGIIFIDTPGHDYFKSQREVTTKISHMTILIIDVVHGINQTHIEVIKYFKMHKIDFIIALNKIDSISEWKSIKDSYLKNTFQNQSKLVMKRLTDYMNNIICQLAEQEINAAPYYNNSDYKTFTSIVPISAKTGEGMMDIMILLSKLLNKKYNSLSKNPTYNNINGYLLDITNGTFGKGYKYIHINSIGNKINNNININTSNNTSNNSASVKHILAGKHKINEIVEPGVYTLILDNTEEFECGDIVINNTKDIDFESLYECNILTLDSVADNYDENGDIVKTVNKAETVELDKNGIGIITVSKSMESPLRYMFSEINVPVSLISNESLSKTHIIKVANNNKPKNNLDNIKQSYNRVIAIFDPTYYSTNINSSNNSIKLSPELRDFAKQNNIEIIFDNTIYKLKTKYLNYKKEIASKIKSDYGHLADVKLEILSQFIFMKTTPLLFGVKVKSGELKVGKKLVAVKDKKSVLLGEVVSIQHEKDVKEKAKVNEQVCIKIDLPTGKVVYKVDFDDTYEVKTFMEKDDIKIYNMFKDEIEIKD
jgi:translation initiation factor 5B